MKKFRITCFVFLCCSTLVLLNGISPAATPQRDQINIESTTNPLAIDIHSLLDDEAKDIIQKALQLGLNIFVTYSSSQERRVFHLFFPLLLRLIKVHGVFLVSFLIHRTISSRTIVWEFTPSSVNVVKTSLGRHIVFILGLGYTDMSRPFYNGGGNVLSLSLTRPIVIGIPP